MTLVVEDGTGKTDAESYASVATANTYHANFGNVAWADFGDDEKEAALRRATQYIDAVYHNQWPGVILNPAQTLDWPRAYIPGWLTGEAPPLQGIYGPPIPTALVQATCEAALRATTSSLMPDLDRGGQVQSKKVGSLAIDYFQGAPGYTTYPTIDHLLASLLEGGRGAGQGMVARG